MRKHSALLRLSGGSIISFFLLATLLSATGVNPLIAAEREMNKQDSVKQSGQQSMPCDSKAGPPCQKHTATTSDTSTDGLPCKSGNACNSPGVQHCGTDDAGTCQTLNLGGQRCSCNCVMP